MFFLLKKNSNNPANVSTPETKPPPGKEVQAWELFFALTPEYVFIPISSGYKHLQKEHRMAFSPAG